MHLKSGWMCVHFLETWIQQSFWPYAPSGLLYIITLDYAYTEAHITVLLETFMFSLDRIMSGLQMDMTYFLELCIWQSF